MSKQKKSAGEKKCIVVYASQLTDNRLVVLQGQWQAKHAKRINKGTLAGLALDAVIDHYTIE